MEVQEAIKSRRSIRRYKATPIDDKTLNIVLEAARWAPSWANTQCWRFIVVKDANTRSELADTLPEGNKAAEGIRQAPVTIVACAERGKSGYLYGDWYMFDLALAMQNLALTAQSLGLGTVYIGWFDAKKVARLLGVPQGSPVVTLTPLGYPDEQPDPTPRTELSEIVSYERY